MNCVKCGHLNDRDARFCESCGANLHVENGAQPKQDLYREETAANQSAQPFTSQQGNGQVYIDKTKTVSKLYFSYFMSALKQPVRVAENTGKENLTNGIITMVLFTLMIVLTSYFALKNALGSLMMGELDMPELSFSSMVVKPFFVIMILLAIISLIIFGAVKLGTSFAGFLDVLARFGTFLVVPTILFVISLLISLIGSYYFIIFFILGLIGFSVAITLTINSYKTLSAGGLDVFYRILLANIAIGILFAITGDAIIQKFVQQFLDGIQDSMNPFGF